MTWQATLKPYKHQINDLGRVDIVIWAEKFFFCCENSGVREGKTRREGPDLPYLPRHEGRPSKNKIHLLLLADFATLLGFGDADGSGRERDF